MRVDIKSLKTKVVCGMHFVDADYMHLPSRYTTSRLTCNAVPSVFCHKNAPKVVVERKKPASRVYVTPTKPKQNATFMSPAATTPSTATTSQSEESTPLMTSKPGPRPKPVVVSTLKSRLWRMQMRLRKSQRALRLQTLKTKNTEAKLRKLQRERPALHQYRPRQQPFMGLQMRSVGAGPNTLPFAQCYVLVLSQVC